MSKHGVIGTSTLIKAINLQFALAGHGLMTKIKPARHGYALVVRDTVTRPPAARA